MDKFTRAYIEAALWSSTDDEGEPLDSNYNESDIAPETLREMQADCKDFQEDFGELLYSAHLTSEQEGHNFWLTRNGHGTGFWDRGLGAIGDALTAAAGEYGEYNLYVGDDGSIYGG